MTKVMAIEPILQAFTNTSNEDEEYILPTSQSNINPAIVSIFVFLVVVLTMEINYFRLAVYKNIMGTVSTVSRVHRDRGGMRGQEQDLLDGEKKRRSRKSSSSGGGCDDEDEDVMITAPSSLPDQSTKTAAAAAATTSLKAESTNANPPSNMGTMTAQQSLQQAYNTIRQTSLTAILTSLVIYSLTATAIALNTRGMDEKVIAIIMGASLFLASLVVFIVSAMIPQWIGVYHQGHIRLVKVSSNYSKHVEEIPMIQCISTTYKNSIHAANAANGTSATSSGASNSQNLSEGRELFVNDPSQPSSGATLAHLANPAHPQSHNNNHPSDPSCNSSNNDSIEPQYILSPQGQKTLRTNVFLGVYFHFAKFYIILMPFYCGVKPTTIPLSIITGVVSGFVLMWCVFVVHSKYIHHRNLISLSTISILSIISSLTFVRGMAWIQIVWKQDIFEDEDVLLVISFFAWLGVLGGVHALFIWHTVRMEERLEREEEEQLESEQDREMEQQNELEQRGEGTSTRNSQARSSVDSLHSLQSPSRTQYPSGRSTPLKSSRNGGSMTPLKSGRSTPGRSARSAPATPAGQSTPVSASRRLRRNSGSYSSFIFDPRTHFVDKVDKDGKHQFSELEKGFTDWLTAVNTSSEDMELHGENPIEWGQNGVKSNEGDDLAQSSNNLEQNADGSEEIPMSQGDLAVGTFVKVEVTSSMDLDLESSIETPIAAAATAAATPTEKKSTTTSYDAAATYSIPKTNNFHDDPKQTSKEGASKYRSRCPQWCQVFICLTPEYKQLSPFWKMITWLKLVVVISSYFLCLYFVAVSIGATNQIASTKDKLPNVREALYRDMNEKEVCAYHTYNPDAANSTITTFENREAAHLAGYKVLHCGACGACSTWNDLRIQYTHRHRMAALANECAKVALFGGEDKLNECLMHEQIGFTTECALCWADDITCTKEYCAFIFLQAQMINNVGNFAVGPDDITSASCEEAHCEVGEELAERMWEERGLVLEGQFGQGFVPCSGATRRRMNIVSSIKRPQSEQCSIVDVESWEDFFFGGAEEEEK